jgi:hypothetical protein
MKLAPIVIFPFLLGIAQAETVRLSNRNVLVDTLRDTVIPHIAAGGSWSTTLTLVNLDLAPSRATLFFADSQGNDLFLNFVGLPQARAQLAFEIPANGSVVIETVDSGVLQQGYALLVASRPFGNDGKIGGVAVFRQTVGGRPDFEAAVPLSPVTEKRFRIPFDNAAGFATGVALMSFGVDAQGDVTMAPATIRAEFWDESGNRLGNGLLTLPPLGHRAFALSDQFPALAGRRGTIEFVSSNDFMAGVGLRFSPGGAFTSVPTLSLPDWNSFPD